MSPARRRSRGAVAIARYHVIVPRRALVICLVVACAHPRAPAPPPRAGVSIAIYDGYAIVDDRRWVELAAGAPLVLDDVDPAAELASLVVEPLAGAGELRVGACARDRVPGVPMRIVSGQGVELIPSRPNAPRFAATVRCAATGRAGRYLVRVAYVSTALHARVAHDLAMIAPDRARLVTTIAIAAPARASGAHAADVVVYDGVPGGERTPRELARAEIALDGSTAVLAQPARDVPASLVRVAPFEHARDEIVPVWVALVVRAGLPPGRVRVHADGRSVDIAAAPRGERLLLWADDSLRVTRHVVIDPTRADTAMRIELAVTNLGDVARELWLEQRVGHAHHRRIERAFPERPTARGDVVRVRIVVAPGAIARAGYTLAYEP